MHNVRTRIVAVLERPRHVRERALSLLGAPGDYREGLYDAMYGMVRRALHQRIVRVFYRCVYGDGGDPQLWFVATLRFEYDHVVRFSPEPNAGWDCTMGYNQFVEAILSCQVTDVP